MSDLNSIEFVDIDGNAKRLTDFPGKAYLVVNVASKCGFTKQYQGLEALHQKYHEKGLQVLGFPCNQFGGQEPGSESEIKQFCSVNYGVTFPMMSKISVNGSDAHPLFNYLKENAKGVLGTEGIKWNFTKFLMLADGSVLKRYAPTTEPSEIETDIEANLT